MPTPLVLGYWDLRGLAAPIRLLLEHAGVDWKDKLYVCGPAPTFDKSTWFDEKPKLGLDFPNNPYLIDADNGVKLSQTHAILRYLARKHGLVGETEVEMTRIDLAEFEEIDLRGTFVSLCYNPDFEKLKGGFLEVLPTKMRLWSEFLGERKWLAGDKLSYVDFCLFDLLDQLLVLEPTALKGCKNLQNYQARFAGLDKIGAYMSSDRYIKYPLNNRMAKFGA